MLIGILAGSIPNVDLGQMVPSDYVFDVIQAHYSGANLYRGHTAHSIMKQLALFSFARVTAQAATPRAG
jgi:hypothetical protein